MSLLLMKHEYINYNPFNERNVKGVRPYYSGRRSQMSDQLLDRRRGQTYFDGTLDDLPLTLEAFRVYCHLIRRASGKNSAFPSYQKIGLVCFGGSFPDSSPESLRQKAIAAIKELISWNLITKITRNRDDGSKSSNQYRLNDQSEWRSSPTEKTELARKKGTFRGNRFTKSEQKEEVVVPNYQGGGSPQLPAGGSPQLPALVVGDYSIKDLNYEGITHIKELGEVVCVEEQKKEQQKQVPIQDLIIHSDSSSDQQNQDSASTSKSTLEVQSCTAISKKPNKPNKQTSQVLESKGKGWQCPEPKFKEDFLHWKGAKMLQDGVRGVDKVNCYSRALGWAGRHPEEANALFLGWFASERETTPENNAPDFTKMGTLIHLELANKLSTMGLEDFVEAESWHKEWIDHVMTLRQQDFSIYNLVKRFVNQN